MSSSLGSITESQRVEAMTSEPLLPFPWSHHGPYSPMGFTSFSAERKVRRKTLARSEPLTQKTNKQKPNKQKTKQTYKTKTKTKHFLEASKKAFVPFSESDCVNNMSFPGYISHSYIAATKHPRRHLRGGGGIVFWSTIQRFCSGPLSLPTLSPW